MGKDQPCSPLTWFWQLEIFVKVKKNWCVKYVHFHWTCFSNLILNILTLHENYKNIMWKQSMLNTNWSKQRFVWGKHMFWGQERPHSIWEITWWIMNTQIHEAPSYQMNAKDAFSSTSWLEPSVDITPLWKK